MHQLYSLRGRMKGSEVSVMKSAMDMIDGLRLRAGVRPPHVKAFPADVANLKKLVRLHGLRAGFGVLY